MSSPYAGDDTLYPATIPVLDDADLTAPAAAAWAPALEGLADRTAYLAARLTGTQVVVPMNPCNLYGLSNEGGGAADRFLFASTASLGMGWLQADVTDAGALVFHLNPALPFKCKITSVEVRFACLNQAGLPGTMPQITLTRSDSAAMATPVAMGTKVDPSNEAVFESSHIVYLDCDVDLTPTEDIDYDSAADVQYFLAVNGQTGANAAANKFMLKQVYAIIEVP